MTSGVQVRGEIALKEKEEEEEEEEEEETMEVERELTARLNMRDYPKKNDIMNFF